MLPLASGLGVTADASQLLFRGCQLFLAGLGLGVTLGHVEIIVATVTLQPLRRQLDHSIHQAQQGAIVTDDHESAPPIGQSGLKRLARFAVQVVRRLIKYEQVGAPQE